MTASMRIVPPELATEVERTPPLDISEDALALAFSEAHAHSIRYTAAERIWRRWTGTRWEPDTDLTVFDLARTICRETARSCTDAKLAASLRRAATVAAVERLARSDRRHATPVDQWDRDIYLLGTPDGTVELRTGVLRPARPDDFITRLTAVGPGGGCPLWLEHINRVTCGDAEYAQYLQRLCGYVLTGDTREHVLPFAHGLGANGKSVTADTLVGLLGDHARTAPMETFTASRSDRHPTELAFLRDARLVVAQETEEGRAWAESRIKALTGGDPIPARFMRGDFFTFRPEFKLLIVGNHKPTLRTVDEAMRRRLHLLPFAAVIPPEERDPELKEKLRAEWPGILQWAIDGCLLWQRDGLRPPACVQLATSEYFEGQDAVQNWLDECCTIATSNEESSAALFGSWKAWAERAGERPGNATSFAEALKGKGFTTKRLGHARTRGFVGLSLKTDSRNAYLAA